MDNSTKIDECLEDEDTRNKIVSDWLDKLYQSKDEKRLLDFYDDIYDRYEDEIIEYTSDLIVEGKA